MKLLKTDNGFYLCELRGVVFITWVSESDRNHAVGVPDDKVDDLKEYILSATGIKTESVEV